MKLATKLGALTLAFTANVFADGPVTKKAIDSLKVPQ